MDTEERKAREYVSFYSTDCTCRKLEDSWEISMFCIIHQGDTPTYIQPITDPDTNDHLSQDDDS